MQEIFSFEDVIPHIRPGSRIILHSGFSEPQRLAHGLARHAGQLQDVELFCLMPMGEAPYADVMTVRTFFPGKGLRKAVTDGRVELIRSPLSAVWRYFRQVPERPTLLMLQLSAPGRDGAMTLGITVDYMRQILDMGPMVVAEINARMPATCGNTRIDASEIDFALPTDEAPLMLGREDGSGEDRRIADNIAGLIASECVLQVGIGAVPDMVLARLGHLRNLGIHSGIVTDAIVPLIEAGVVTNASKAEFKGRSIATMAGGTQRLYDFLDGNPLVEFHPSLVTHGADTLGRIAGLCAINSVLQVDLSGAANAETRSGRKISAPGGLPDFAAAAARSASGRSILALRSTSQGGSVSNICAAGGLEATTLEAGQVDYVVTEHGVARLSAGDPAERARQLIEVADPAFRSDLRRGLSQFRSAALS